MGALSIRRVLVANRGEIAVRVIRACHDLGIEAVAVYSDADIGAPHVRLADRVYALGGTASADSYLRVDKVLEACRVTGCDAVHPGYGFLSENAAFAAEVLEAGLTWVGPSPHAITAMGSKTGARQRMHAAGVPVVPGTLEPVRTPSDAIEAAKGVGYPLLIKASAGGGGKGMRLVRAEEELTSAFNLAQSEARKSFGDDAIYLERFIDKPRHVEIQVLADGHGNVVHLFERDCSIQRRHQKVFEEAPCPVLDADTRKKMTDAACRAAKAVDYCGAGTVEFLLGADQSFYFLEMNTRLQVEHPITECITGVDLVTAQLRIASGDPLWFTQDDIRVDGWAVECRVYAEDAAANFRPTPGPLHVYREPQGIGVRVDSGVEEGMDVPIHYDPMIAKLIVWGPDRETALRRANRALREYTILGTQTSIPFFLALFEDAGFQAGTYDTGFISPEWLTEQLETAREVPEEALFLAAIEVLEQRGGAAPKNVRASSNWKWSGARGWKGLS
jgi:acetyl-CoA carboxylase biotin carboxylase subunit